MDDERVTFRKSGMQMAADGCLPQVGAVLFLGMAVASVFGAFGADLLTRLTFGGLAGFFGLLMASAAVTSAGRGSDPRVVEAGPDGIWLPEMGHLPWSALAEVRLETLRGVGGGDGPTTVGHRRLGVVPRDSTIRPSGATTAGSAMAGAFVALLRRLEPRLRLGIDDPAPFSAGEPELGRADFERLLELTRRYVTVIDSAERRARERAPRWSSTASAASADAQVVDIGAIDAALGGARGPVARIDSAAIVDPATVRSQEPRASFRAPLSSTLGLIGHVVPIVVPVAMMVGLPLTAASRGDVSSISWFLLLWVAVVGGFLVAAARPLVAELRRRRAFAANPVSLEVSPDGIRLPPEPLIPWSDVAEIRTERAGYTEGAGGVPIERWSLVVVRATGSGTGRTGAIESDRIDATFDEVLDLVRYYHPVHETG